LVADQPFSFTGAVQSLQGSVDSTARCGVSAGSRPSERGKSKISTNLQLIAHAGGRVLLVDLDLRNPSLSRGLAPDSKGLIDIISGKMRFEDAVWIDRSTNLAFLPSGATPKMLHTNEILSSEIVRKLFENLRSAYDYVIVDLPPLAPVVDVRATTNIIDSFVYVVEWGRTKIDVVTHNLSNAAGVYDRLLGVVLNKADTNILCRYEGYHGNYYYNKYYARYGYTE
jgi:succinoglycan biosynthesis transport protein ExoP